MRMRSLATLAGIVFLAGACTDARLVDSVSQLKPKESGFKANLHKEYVDLAKAELEEGDIYDTGVFARRAEAAAMGKGVDPDVLWDRSYSKKNADTLFSERDRLLAALDGGGRANHGALAARAQAMFDCWAQEQEENTQPPDIERCRSGYLKAMDQLAAAMKPASAPKVAAKPKPKPKKKAKKVAVENPYIVYFDYDSTTIADMESVGRITAAAKVAKANKSTRIEVTGHTDTSGASDYNQRLSEARAKVVDEALIALGINGLIIERHASGEGANKVNTGDGVREGKNRRVEINVR